MGEVEGHIDELEEQILAIREEQISGDNVYQLLLAFDELYAELEDIEKRDVLRAIVERVDLYPEKRSDGCWVKNIVFNFPVPVGGVELKELPLENATTLETVCLLSKLFGAKNTIDVKVDMDELDVTSAEALKVRGTFA